MKHDHPTPATPFDPVATWEAHAGTAYETQALRTIEEHARANGDTELAAVTGWLADLDQAARDGNTGDFEDIMDDYRDRAAAEAWRARCFAYETRTGKPWDSAEWREG